MYFKEEDKIFKQEKEKEKNGKKFRKMVRKYPRNSTRSFIKKRGFTGYNTLTNQNKGGTS